MSCTSVWQEVGSAPGVHSQEGLQGEGPVQGRGRVTMSLQSVPSLPPPRRISGLTQRTRSYCLHSAKAWTPQGRPQAGFMLHLMGASVSHSLPTRAAEGPRKETTAHTGPRPRQPSLAEQPVLLGTLLSSPTLRGGGVWSREMPALHDFWAIECAHAGLRLGRVSYLVN